MISCSDVLQASIIYLMVSLVRISSEAEDGMEFSTAEVKTFSAKALQYLCRRTSLSSNHDDLSSKFVAIKELQAIFVEDQFVEKIFDHLNSLTNFENFLNFMEKTLAEIFQLPVGSTENGLCGPYRVNETSFLGIFLRAMMAKWVAIDFDSQCMIYDQFCQFMQSDSEWIMEEQQDEVFSPPSPLSNRKFTGLESLLQELEEATQHYDIARAEKLIHDYFDTTLYSNTGNLLLLTTSSHHMKANNNNTTTGNPTTNNTNVNNSNNPITALLQELQSITTTPQEIPYKSNQTAMLCLATLYLKVGNYDQAFLAVEEAMKSAHQRGDHQSVVKSLYLLFHIKQREVQQISSNSKENKNNQNKQINYSQIVSILSISSAQNEYLEDILQRIYHRASSLQLHELVAETSLLFADLKLFEYYETYYYQLYHLHMNTNNNNNDHHHPKNSSNWMFRDLHILCTFIQHGETNLLYQYYQTKENMLIDELLSTSLSLMNNNNNNMLLMNKNNNNNNSNNNSQSSFNNRLSFHQKGYFEMLIKVTIFYIELYSQQQFYELAMDFAIRLFHRLRRLRIQQQSSYSSSLWSNNKSVHGYIDVPCKSDSIVYLLQKTLFAQLNVFFHKVIYQHHHQQQQYNQLLSDESDQCLEQTTSQPQSQSSFQQKLIQLLTSYTQYISDSKTRLLWSNHWSKYSDRMMQQLIMLIAMFIACEQNDFLKAWRLSTKLLLFYQQSGSSLLIFGCNGLFYLEKLDELRYCLFAHILHKKVHSLTYRQWSVEEKLQELKETLILRESYWYILEEPMIKYLLMK
jgi:hypothetical protein